VLVLTSGERIGRDLRVSWILDSTLWILKVVRSSSQVLEFGLLVSGTRIPYSNR